MTGGGGVKTPTAPPPFFAATFPWVLDPCHLCELCAMADASTDIEFTWNLLYENYGKNLSGDAATGAMRLQSHWVTDALETIVNKLAPRYWISFEPQAGILLGDFKLQASRVSRSGQSVQLLEKLLWAVSKNGEQAVDAVAIAAASRHTMSNMMDERYMSPMPVYGENCDPACLSPFLCVLASVKAMPKLVSEVSEISTESWSRFRTIHEIALYRQVVDCGFAGLPLAQEQDHDVAPARRGRPHVYGWEDSLIVQAAEELS
ncbi:hypothetical protein CPC08DRAFT_725342 [Agrocybe pediades]|nr:hypothetical protein CPC08DRAFT_725342 [Agrocybe pediades]